ncbi:MAG TPA: adenylosuccinate synthase [Candidatus Binataceae bacterium]|nr:adenylosuccinate synthase [Candidatus Binataceae bacterium]
MNTVAVVGIQWGDEGKGKVVDLLAADAEIVVRFHGGNNAAHTLVVNGRKLIVRQIPAGVLHPNTVCVIGNGTVVDPLALIGELDNLRAHSLLTDPQRLKLSYDAHMVMPYHGAIDRAREARLAKAAIGTTGFGIGPAYEDKAARIGLRLIDLLDFKKLEEKLKRNLADKNAYLKAVLKAPPVNGRHLLEQLRMARKRLLPHLCDTALYLDEAIRAGRKVLFEGAHGTMLDIDHGTYPFVTSSSCLASALFAGTGVPPDRLRAVLGISKAYTTRVGGGPFPTEIKTKLGQRLREEGEEFGAATGRPRRIGWFDAVLARHSARLNGAWGMALTKLDVLSGIDPLKVAIAYEHRGQRYEQMPPGRVLLDRVRPLYEELPGWHESLDQVRSLADLPTNARRYLDRIAELTGVPIAMIGTGAAREATIVINNPFAV